jgi:transcriptional regulator with XRE-family HTH domain
MSNIKEYKMNAIDSILEGIDPKLEKQVELRMKLAVKIDKARKKIGLSKTQLAHRLSKKPSEITKWLSGTHNFTIDTLSDIQQLLGIELVNVDENQKEQVLYLSISVTQENPTYNYDFLNPLLFSKTLIKSSISDIKYPLLENLKTKANA